MARVDCNNEDHAFGGKRMARNGIGRHARGDCLPANRRVGRRGRARSGVRAGAGQRACAGSEYTATFDVTAWKVAGVQVIMPLRNIKKRRGHLLSDEAAFKLIWKSVMARFALIYRSALASESGF
ncbi:hypothetical protein [Burkholderia lata]|uniref:hypothetical protein n=1 Tax=Burkholderia lata (strain ATCC 17760 / DSM 23089 / LMG 22485 / NCIMB 9086 / R18194 / 383) TaxID=482957 RepID=UPI00399BD44E